MVLEVLRRAPVTQERRLKNKPIARYFRRSQREMVYRFADEFRGASEAQSRWEAGQGPKPERGAKAYSLGTFTRAKIVPHATRELIIERIRSLPNNIAYYAGYPAPQGTRAYAVNVFTALAEGRTVQLEHEPVSGGPGFRTSVNSVQEFAAVLHGHGLLRSQLFSGKSYERLLALRRVSANGGFGFDNIALHGQVKEIENGASVKMVIAATNGQRGFHGEVSSAQDLDHVLWAQEHLQEGAALPSLTAAESRLVRIVDNLPKNQTRFSASRVVDGTFPIREAMALLKNGADVQVEQVRNGTIDKRTIGSPEEFAAFLHATGQLDDNLFNTPAYRSLVAFHALPLRIELKKTISGSGHRGGYVPPHATTTSGAAIIKDAQSASASYSTQGQAKSQFVEGHAGLDQLIRNI